MKWYSNVRLTPNTRQQRTAEVDIKGMRGGW